jgi:Zn-finger nucleic acid-binding protein
MMFMGSSFCPHCGSEAVQWQAGDGELTCPACRVAMLRGALGQNTIHECGKCFGIWLDTATFERICRDSEQHAAVLGRAQDARAMNLGPVRYVPCPQCHQLMNRVNFARCSGVVLDVCRRHGIWFDMQELHRIVQFIRAGGLEVARDRQRLEFEKERRQHEARGASWTSTSARAPDVDLLSLAVRAAGGVLGKWLT